MSTLRGHLRHWLAPLAFLACLAAILERLHAADAPAAVPAAPKFGKAARPNELSPAIIIRAGGRIGPRFRAYLLRHLQVAKKDGAKLIILEIDSPGGILDYSVELADELQQIDWAHTVAYVPSEAISGGAIVALGCDEIIMGPAAQIGDAGAVIRGDDALFRHAPEKVISDASVKLRRLAEAKGRSPAICEAMINKKLEVFECTNHKTGEKRYYSEADLRAAADRQDWEQGKPVVETIKELFFTCTGERAVELGLASATVADRGQLMTELGLKAMPKILEYTWVDTFALILNWWPVTILLFVVALISLYIELHAPGIGVAGIFSALCFALFFWSRFLGGTADVLEVILFILGVVCVGLELFVTTGTLVAGVSGFFLILASLVMAGQENWIPANQTEVNSLAGNLGAIFGAGVLFVIAATFLSSRMQSLPIFNRLMLDPPEAETAVAASSAAAGPTIAVGNQGVSATALRPVGKARFGNLSLEVTSDGSIIDPGRPIRVVEISGNRIFVAEVT